MLRVTSKTSLKLSSLAMVVRPQINAAILTSLIVTEDTESEDGASFSSRVIIYNIYKVDFLRKLNANDSDHELLD